MTSYRYLKFSSILLFGLLSLASCKTVSIYESEPSLSQERNRLIQDARKLLGASYQYAGNGPKKFDCSGMISYVYKQSGIQVAGSASHLYQSGRSISLQEVQPGDLVFYKRGREIFHVSLISRVKRGEIWVIHSTTSRGVIEEDILSSSYWKPLIYKTVSLRSYK